MRPSGLLRSSVAGLILLIGVAANCAVGGGFLASLTEAQLAETGLVSLTPEEKLALDELVAADLSTARFEPDEPLAGTFSTRHGATDIHAAGLDRLSPAQLQQVDRLVASNLATRPQPRNRPRLKDNEVVSLARRLEVHGGMSFTYGWASGGRDFREVGAWVSYFDPVTGFGLAIGLSQASGDLFPFYGYGPYGDGYYSDWGYTSRRFDDYAFPMSRARLSSISLGLDRSRPRHGGHYVAAPPAGRRF